VKTKDLEEEQNEQETEWHTSVCRTTKNSGSS